jgi:ketosteroid isomerase-like protein
VTGVLRPSAVVVEFNAAINGRDLAGLADLMTESHRFIDADGVSVEGKDACIAAWRGFFDAFPDYRNIFDRLDETDATVIVSGRSACSVAALDGPATWRAVVVGGRVDVWQVSAPEPS